MLSSKLFLDFLISHDVSFFSGVPCSFLKTFINQVSSNPNTTYIPASSEGEAIALVSGAWLSGRLGAVLCQNSGLGNMVNPLTSLNSIFGIPALLFIGYRGKPGENDEPQHKMMGNITQDLLSIMDIPWETLPKSHTSSEKLIYTAIEHIKNKRSPFAVLVEKNTFDEESFTCNDFFSDLRPSRIEILKVLLNFITNDTPLFATTGKTARELYTLKDRCLNFYCFGSMGYANALANGLALNTKQKVFILDGDGAAIMHLGNFATIGNISPKNLVHIVLDNGMYDSTGMQKTVSKTVDFCKLATDVGYNESFDCKSSLEFQAALSNLKYGPVFIHVNIKPGSIKNLGRPDIIPNDIVSRFKENINRKILNEI